jgi:hypothetical protein
MLEKLEQWYSKHSNGDWEHQHGIKIDTLDNPGWELVIDLKNTELENKVFVQTKIERSENDWYHCSVVENKFIGNCGPLNLQEVLNVFFLWSA